MNHPAKQHSAVRTCVFCLCFFVLLVCAVLRSYWPAKMTDVKEQRVCIKFCFELGKLAAETHKMLKKTSAQGQMQSCEWFKRFKNRQMSVDGEERTQQPSTGTRTKNAAQVQEAIMEDQ